MLETSKILNTSKYLIYSKKVKNFTMSNQQVAKIKKNFFIVSSEIIQEES